jgi:hypothetical protein
MSDGVELKHRGEPRFICELAHGLFVTLIDRSEQQL